ncbi:MAG: nickel pincer cofactor biosynthesis protein LarB [Ignavibacteriales bacterium]|nr:nickel pincer cofactor biosynthesis protein LarB [Ignavibacteriales bacterium]
MKKHDRHYRDTLESFAHLDYFRRERTGIPEAILAEGKSDEQIAILLERMVEKTGVALATRVAPGSLNNISRRLEKVATITYHESGRVVVAMREGHELPKSGGAVAILAAGTSDVPVAEEARVTAETMGCRVLTFYDVGVAGIHRLVAPLEQIRENDVAAVVAVAGMEGALPTVVRSLVPVPVIGVPTSIGYGYGGKGEAALMTMLQSCAPGLTVVNIDNGFGAGATAALIANRIAQVRKAAQKPARRNKKRV